MAYLNISATKHTPAVRASEEESYLTIQGECYPENAAEFFEPIFLWISDYFATALHRQLAVVFAITYINSASQKQVTEIVNELNQFYNADHNIRAEWMLVYDGDEDEHDTAKEYKEDALFPFTITPARS